MSAFHDFKPAYFEMEDRDGVIVATITLTSLSEENNIEILGQELTQLVDQFGCRRLVVDFQNVTMITSTVLGKFISLHRNLHRREGQLVLCGLFGMVIDVLQTTKLNEYFRITNTVPEAVALLNGSKA